MAQGVAWSARAARRAVRGRRPRPRAARQARRDRAPRRAQSCRCRSSAGGRCSSSTATRASTGVRPPGERPGGDRRQRHDRPRDPRGPAGRRRPSSSPTAAAGCPAASPPPSRASTRRPRLRLRGRDRRAARAALAAGAPTAIDYRPSFVDGIGGRSLLAEMWPLASTLLAGASSSRSRRSPPRSACSSRGRASSPKARARRRWPLRWPAARLGRGRSGRAPPGGPAGLRRFGRQPRSGAAGDDPRGPPALTLW